MIMDGRQPSKPYDSSDMCAEVVVGKKKKSVG